MSALNQATPLGSRVRGNDGIEVRGHPTRCAPTVSKLSYHVIGVETHAVRMRKQRTKPHATLLCVVPANAGTRRRERGATTTATAGSSRRFGDIENIRHAGFDHFPIEITRLSISGFALRVGDDELHLAFDQFPWFREATLEQLTAIEWPTSDHLYLPGLDIDLSIASIRDPAAFPRVSSGSRRLND